LYGFYIQSREVIQENFDFPTSLINNLTKISREKSLFLRSFLIGKNIFLMKKGFEKCGLWMKN
ncbi:MAG: hypothetical protein Q9M94_00860, partial [Candidatus Gracilibacteria bacterium]|nr:hypothetical protein [Candidatus Gracilibacteria bacterium]